MPGNLKYGIRGRVLATRTSRPCIPHRRIWSGPTPDPHLQGPPAADGEYRGAPFRLVTHVGELGHVLVAGPSRTGESGLLGAHGPPGFRYPGMRMCLFDRDDALKAVTLLHGGQHYALGSAGSLRLHPGRHRHGRAAAMGDRVAGACPHRGKGRRRSPRSGGNCGVRCRCSPTCPGIRARSSMARQLLQVTRLKVGLAPFCEGGEYSFCDGSTQRSPETAAHLL